MDRERLKQLIYLLLPLPGLWFCLNYIWRAGANIIYTDYIRITCNYLPDVFDIHKFLVPDILTRVPVNYLARIVNVLFFGYDTRFDMVLGAVCLAAAAWILGSYCYRKKLNIIWYLMVLLVMFSLNKWEMLLNGTGWVHFLAFACFYYYFIVVDRAMLKGQAKRHDELLLKILPFLFVFTVTGNYCASPYAVIVLLYIWCAWKERKETGSWNKKYMVYILCNIIPVLLYWISSQFVNEPPVGVATGSILAYLIEDPLFFIKFLIKSFGTMLIGEETAQYWNLHSGASLSGTTMAALGVVVIVFYLAALIIYWREKLYKISWLPLLLMLSGGLNHLIILIARWRFLKKDYGMSSRYALQFQVGILGIILTFALASKCRREWNRKKVCAVAVLSAVICITILSGNLITTYSENSRAQYRRDYFESLQEFALREEPLTEEELGWFQYKYLDLTQKALDILKENHLNIFYKKE